jgi:hypothetical protein
MRFVLLLVVAALGLGCERVVLYWMTPAGPFDPGQLPAPPDYAAPASWSALPEREDAADAEAPGLPAADQRSASADVFYVHPTSYVGRLWNAPVDDARLNADTDRVATRIQASAFNACCAVFAPRYRQANGTAFTHPSEDGRRALDVAYADVRAAFRHFLAHTDAGRPFLLASHSQGSVLAYRLLREEIAPTALRERLVAAWLIGAPLTEEAVARELPDVPLCASPEQTGCLIGWNARGSGYEPGTFEFAAEPGAQLCVNPLSWRHDEVAMPAWANHGAVFLDAEPPLLAPGFASARCQNGRLVVSLTGRPPRDLMSRLLDRALGPGNFHPIEYQLFFTEIRQNAAERLRTWLSSRAPAR